MTRLAKKALSLNTVAATTTTAAIGGALLLSFLWSASPARAQKYVARILPTGGGFRHSTARATSNGVHVGYAWNTESGHFRSDGPIDLNPDSSPMLDGPLDSHASLWRGSPPAYVDIHQTKNTFLATRAVGIKGDFIVGFGYYNSDLTGRTELYTEPLQWTSQAAFQDGMATQGSTKHSRALNTDGTRVAGWEFLRQVASTEKGLLWNGDTLTPLVSNNLGQLDRARAFGVHGTTEVGYVAGSLSDQKPHAALWMNDGMFSDLHPSGHLFSIALGVFGNQQVGVVGGSIEVAALWTGTPGSFVSLMPSGFVNSRAEAVRTGRQVGYGTVLTNGVEGNAHALVWASRPDLYVDLHSLLPAGFVASRAYGIGDKTSMGTEAGDIVGEAVKADGTTQAVVWEAQPAALASVAAPGVIYSRTTVRINLDGMAPTGGATVMLSGSGISVPPSVTLADGTTYAYVPVTVTSYLGCGGKGTGGGSLVAITATYRGISITRFMTVQ